MIKNFSADYILPVNQAPIRNGVVSVTETGEIIGLYENADSAEIKGQEIEHYEGVIVPGFVNSHCHLELSHLHQQIAEGEGLLSFLSSVIHTGKAEDSTVKEAIEKADKTMFENGIVAVGDICNTALSKEAKEKSAIYYHSCIEVFGFNPEKAQEVLDAGLALQEEFGSLPTSIVPHAPYSVCKDLFRILRHLCREGDNVLTIHNQESDEENKFYRYKAGEFVDFYENLLKLDISFFKPQARDSVQSVVPLLSKKQKVMLVHNTYTSLKDISFVNRLDREVTWCFCPNANLYIENKLPKLDMFVHSGVNISLGTDSLASNDKLCMLSELKTISQHFPSISLDTSISWATLNGAKHFGIDHKFGSIELGKKPGLNLITEVDGLNLTEASAVKKLI